MSQVAPLERIAVGVVVERRKSNSIWADYVWRPVAVLPGVPDTAPWTALDGDDARMNFYGGAGEILLFRADTEGYRDNLTTGAPLLWVALRPTGSEPAFAIAAVTAEPGEGEALTESPTDLIESVPMPDKVRAIIAEFVAAHHVEQQFVKRQRDRADPEAMAQRAPVKDRK